MCSGNLFYTSGAALEKDLSPNVFKFLRGTSSPMSLVFTYISNTSNGGSPRFHFENCRFFFLWTLDQNKRIYRLGKGKS